MTGAECGKPHPEADLIGWYCNRPEGHEPPHATIQWEEWGEDA